MAEQEVKIFTEKLRCGLLLAEKRLLQERAARGETVILSDEQGNPIAVPAKDIIAAHREYQ